VAVFTGDPGSAASPSGSVEWGFYGPDVISDILPLVSKNWREQKALTLNQWPVLILSS